MANSNSPTTPSQMEALKIVAEFAEHSRTQYADTKKWTSRNGGSCMTMRIPVALLNRIREMATEFGV